MSSQDFQHNEVALDAAARLVVFDRERFLTSTMNDYNLQREVLNLFLDQLAHIRAVINLKPQSSSERKFMAHTLRGAAAAVGASEIESLAKSWEAVNFDPVVLDALLEDARAAFVHEIRTFLS